MKKLRLRIFLK